MIKNLALSIVASLVAAGLIALLGWLLGIIIVASVVVLITGGAKIVSFATSHTGKASNIGILRVSLTKKSPTDSLVGDIGNSFIFWGITGHRTTGNPRIQEAIVHAARTGGEVKFLLMDPDGDCLDRRAKLEGRSGSAWASEIHEAVERLYSLLEPYGIEPEVKFLDEMPVWRLAVADRQLALVNFFLPGRRGTDSPQLKLCMKDGGLLHVLLKEFEYAWARGRWNRTIL